MPAAPAVSTDERVTSARTGSGHTGTASLARATLCGGAGDQAQEHTGRAQRTDLWPEA
jgi:hypothetical protein